MSSRILILDCGSQFTQLIARRVREARVYSEIHPPTRSLEWIKAWNPTGIILSGGPNSVTDEGAPDFDRGILDVAPVLGVCYGLQWITHVEGGTVAAGGGREYGRAMITVEEPEGVFAGFAKGEETQVWMSHGDHVDTPPPGYVQDRVERQRRRRLPARDQAHPRDPVPLRGRAHRPRRRDHRQLPVRRVQGDARLDAGLVRRARDRADSRRSSASST